MKTNTYWLNSLIDRDRSKRKHFEKKNIRATISNKCSSDNKFLVMYLSNHWLHMASLPLFTINPSTELWMMTTLRHDHASRAIFSTDFDTDFWIYQAHFNINNYDYSLKLQYYKKSLFIW